MLTSKQENFAKAIALKEMNHSDAYRDAYLALNMSDAVINNEASILFKDREITVRIEELKEQLDTKVMDKFVKSKEDLLTEMETLKTECSENEKKIKLDAMKEQGKLLGFYEDKLSIKGEFDLAQGIRDYKNRISQYPEYRDKQVE